jgi:hypothetical protein
MTKTETKLRKRLAELERLEEKAFHEVSRAENRFERLGRRRMAAHARLAEFQRRSAAKKESKQ